jgi:O-antigen/teichoic acid export membrane protein
LNSDFWHGEAEFQALFGNFLQPSGLVIRKSLFEDLGGFQESLWRCEDMEFLMRLVTRSPVTLSMSPTYFWRQQQETSLAADSFAPLLKWTGLCVMCCRGLTIVSRHPVFLPVWILSMNLMFFDWIFSKVLRKIRQLETDPANQAVVQAAVALLNMAVPIALGRLLVKEEFGHFRSFGLFLSSVSALSLTSGLWSLIPWWKLNRTQGAQMVSTAWHLQCVAALICALCVFVWAPLESTAAVNNNIILALSAAVLLPSVFLEQHFNVRGKGLLSAFIVGISEVAKTATMIVMIFWQQALSHVLLVIPAFLLVRLMALKQLTREITSSPFSSSSFTHAASVVRSAWPVGVSAALAVLAATFDRFFLVHRLSAAEFSLVAAGTLSFPMAALLEQSVMQHRLQEIAISLQNREFKKCAQIIRECIGKIAKFAIPWSATLVLFAPEILFVLFAERYKDAAGVMRIFAFANILNCVPPDALSRAQGCSGRILVFSGASALLSICLVVVGYSWFGILGAIAGGVFAAAVGRVGFFLADVVRNGLRISWIIPSQFNLLSILCIVLCLFILKMIAPIFGLPHWAVLSAAALLLISTVIPNETLAGLLKGSKRGAERC